ncbi:MAG: hypothetical protein AAF085_04195 [Planctomycetota bacterium]
MPSPTGKHVGALLLERITEQRIAEILDRSPNTLHSRVRNIFSKLDPGIAGASNGLE